MAASAPPLLFLSPPRPNPSYAVTGLAPGAAYEVRVSHPATIPAFVRIQVHEPRQPSARPPRPGPPPGRRALLDTTKAALTVAADAGRGEAAAVAVTVTATSRGAYAPASGGPPPALPVAITVERLVGGVLPADAGPVVAACAVLLAAVLAVVPWWTERGVQVVGGWLDGGRGEAGEGEGCAASDKDG
jgi:hypothetical protein